MPDDDTPLAGKVAVVTGAGLGIGAAIARALGAAGAAVYCAARTSGDLDAVVADIVAGGGEAHAVRCDVTRFEEVEALARRVDEGSGGLDIAFLNAGANTLKASVVDSDVDAWRYAVDLNMNSVFYGLKAFVPLMRKRGGGRFVFTGSAMAHYPAPANASYCAAKAGARMLMRTAALELADEDITVNEIIPGPTRTRQALVGVSDDPNSPFNNPKEWVKEPEDVVDLAMFVATCAGKGPTGQTFSLARR